VFEENDRGRTRDIEVNVIERRVEDIPVTATHHGLAIADNATPNPGVQANPTPGPQLFFGAGIFGNSVTDVGRAGFQSGLEPV